MKALLLSGGMDSISVAFWKRPEIAISIDYGQRAAEAEITAANRSPKKSECGMILSALTAAR